MLMSAGSVIYFNQAKLAANYFAELGFKCPVKCNPADYFLIMMTNMVNQT